VHQLADAILVLVLALKALKPQKQASALLKTAKL